MSTSLPLQRSATLGEEVSPQRLSTAAHLVAVSVSVALWALSLQGLNLRLMTDLGLLSVLPITFYLSLAVLCISCCILIFQQRVATWVFILHIFCLIVFIHGSPSILYRYEDLRYSWAWKHVGIIDYIQRHGTVDPNISSMSAYHNWPGFFTLNTLLTQVAGFESARSFAAWAPAFFHVLNLGAAMIIFRTFTRDQRLVWLAVWFFMLGNWVGQDYFSPQALNFFMHLVILAVCLTWFRQNEPPTEAVLKRWLRVGVLARLLSWLLQSAHRYDPPTQLLDARQAIGLVGIMVLISMAINTSHQITPIMTVVSVLGLVVAQRCTARTLPIIFGILTVAWVIFPASAFLEPAVESFVEAFGRLGQNTELIDLNRASEGQQIVALMGRILTVGIIGVAFLGTLRLFHNRRFLISCLVLAAAPFAVLAMNSYGGEIIFRVFLFSLPFAAFLAASLIYPTMVLGHSRRAVLLSMLLTGVFLTTFLFAYYGKERQYYFTPEEVAATEYLYKVAPPNSLIIEASLNYPTFYRNYEYFTHVAIDREPREGQLSIAADPVSVLTRWMNNQDYAAVYIIFTRSQIASVDDVGDQQFSGTMRDITKAVIASPSFTIIYQNSDATILELNTLDKD